MLLYRSNRHKRNELAVNLYLMPRSRLLSTLLLLTPLAAQTGIITTIAGTGTAGFSGDGGPATNAAIALANLQNQVRPEPLRADQPHRVRCQGQSLFRRFQQPAHPPHRSRRHHYHRRRRRRRACRQLRTRSPRAQPAPLQSRRRPAAPQRQSADRRPAEQPHPPGLAHRDGHHHRRQWPAQSLRARHSRHFLADGLAHRSGAGFRRPDLLLRTPRQPHRAHQRRRQTHHQSRATAFPGAATLTKPAGIAIDRDNNVLSPTPAIIASAEPRPNGTLTTIAGTGTQSFCGDRGPALTACFDTPMDVKLDCRGNIYIADAGNHRIRRIDAASRQYHDRRRPDPCSYSLRHRARRQTTISTSSTGRTTSSAKSRFRRSPTGGIVDGASFSAPPAPGGIFSIFGANFSAATESFTTVPLAHRARRREPGNQRRRRSRSTSSPPDRSTRNFPSIRRPAPPLPSS